MSIDPHLIQGNESPPVRNTILGTLLRGRRHSQSHERETSPDPPSPMMPPPGVSGGFSQMLRRRRSGGLASPGSSQPPVVPGTLALAASNMTVTPSAMPANNGAAVPAPMSPVGAGTHRIRLVPHLDSRRSLRFDVFNRELKEGDAPLRIGRFTERSTGPNVGSNNLNGKIAFRSKVVSRAHAEMWVESGGRFFIRDTKSSSGTFLNHVRLSPANAESPPRQVRDGDIVQLGVDYQGGAEDIYKSVKIRIEVGREWQSSKNAFNTGALENLKALATAPGLPRTGKSNIPDCCICLFGVTIRQALFIAPCSHTFHYKCIRPLLENHHPAFSCPLCRTFADLDEDVEIEQEPVEDSEEDEPEKPLSPSVTINKKQKQKAREEREKERDREGGADTEVEGDAQAQVQARRNSRMSMMEENDEEEDRYNAPNAWMVIDGEIGSSDAVHVGSSNDVVMHVEDKSDRSHSP